MKPYLVHDYVGAEGVRDSDSSWDGYKKGDTYTIPLDFLDKIDGKSWDKVQSILHAAYKQATEIPGATNIVFDVADVQNKWSEGSTRRLYIKYERPRTELEAQRAQEKREAIRISNEARDRAEYERLVAKFGK